MSENPKNTEEIREYQDKPGGQFTEGNPGKPKGAKNKYTIAKLEEAIEAQEKIAKESGGVGVFEHFVKMGYSNSNVMISLMRKFVPDKSHTELSTPEPINININKVK